MAENVENAAKAAVNPEPTNSTPNTEVAVDTVRESSRVESHATVPVLDPEPSSEDSVNPEHKEDDDPQSQVGDEAEDGN